MVFKVLNVNEDANLRLSLDDWMHREGHEQKLAVDRPAASVVVERDAPHWGLLKVMVQPCKVAGLLQGAA